MERLTEPDGESWGPAGTPSERGTRSKYSTAYSGERQERKSITDFRAYDFTFLLDVGNS